MYVLWTLTPTGGHWEFGGIYRTTYACARHFPHVTWQQSLDEWPREVDGKSTSVLFRLVLEKVYE